MTTRPFSGLELFDTLFHNNATVGFEALFRRFDTDILERVGEVMQSYPPYNIIEEQVDEDKFTTTVRYTIEIALAGFRKDEVQVQVKNSTLSVTAKKSGQTDLTPTKILHHGISKRAFVRTFTLAENVRALSAKMEDGLLKITLEKNLMKESPTQMVIE